MVIFLSSRNYESFLRRISKTSPARLTLAKAREIDTHPSSKLTSQWLIVCARPNAAALRNAAEECCHEALPEIERAFKHDRFYWVCATTTNILAFLIDILNCAVLA